jgi:hypothetical protein
MAKKKAKAKPKIKTTSVTVIKQPRTTTDTCSTCIKYDTTTATCRLNPPIYLQRQSAPTDPAWSWQWPIVQATDWCYQWSLT